MQIIPTMTGKASWFGGPNDTGVAPDEGLALMDYSEAIGSRSGGLFIHPIDGDRGLARQLNPRALYCAMRWDYGQTPQSQLLNAIVRVQAGNGNVIWARPADWGPNIDTGRLIDLSHSALVALGIATDDMVTVDVFA